MPRAPVLPHILGLPRPTSAEPTWHAPAPAAQTGVLSEAPPTQALARGWLHEGLGLKPVNPSFEASCAPLSSHPISPTRPRPGSLILNHSASTARPRQALSLQHTALLHPKASHCGHPSLPCTPDPGPTTLLQRTEGVHLAATCCAKPPYCPPPPCSASPVRPQKATRLSCWYARLSNYNGYLGNLPVGVFASEQAASLDSRLGTSSIILHSIIHTVPLRPIRVTVRAG
jgi:hypothetical protein